MLVHPEVKWCVKVGCQPEDAPFTSFLCGIVNIMRHIQYTIALLFVNNLIPLITTGRAGIAAVLILRGQRPLKPRFTSEFPLIP